MQQCLDKLKSIEELAVKLFEYIKGLFLFLLFSTTHAFGEPSLNDPPLPPAGLSVESNLRNARWILYQHDVKVYAGRGPARYLVFPQGGDYRLEAEEVQGYRASVLPSTTFLMIPGRRMIVKINYTRTFGYLEIQGAISSEKTINAVIQPSMNAPPLSISLNSENGFIHWRSPPIPTGTYTINWSLPDPYLPLQPSVVKIEEGQPTIITPNFEEGRSIHVKTNQDAIFTLSNNRTGQTLQGEGRDYTFENLTPGSYTLNFGNVDPERYLTPPPQIIDLSKQMSKDIQGNYRSLGVLVLPPQIARARIYLTSLGIGKEVIEQELSPEHPSLMVPEGTYQSVIEVLDKQGNITQTVEQRQKILAFQTNMLSFETGRAPAPLAANQARLVVALNIPGGGFQLVAKEDREHPSQAALRFRGKLSTITITSQKSYTLLFDPVPNYRTPASIDVQLKSGEEHRVDAAYENAADFSKVPRGSAIVGDPFHEGNSDELPSATVEVDEFEISTYPITNAQYATWLTKALESQKIVYSDAGIVVDQNNSILFKTGEAEPNSQIIMSKRTSNQPVFIPLPGKENFPVLLVTWFGAQAYCLDNQCRLPTEAEWEKAAGMQVTKPGKPLKKYRYGFSRDTIDRTWANYKDSDRGPRHFRVMTSEVGFYNGTNPLPLNENNLNQEITHKATSPIGAYDMSGNIYEWVNDWYSPTAWQDASASNPQGPSTGVNKVAKGGCYDSLAYGVRVSARLALPPEHSDVYTGFRVVKK